MAEMERDGLAETDKIKTVSLSCIAAFNALYHIVNDFALIAIVPRMLKDYAGKQEARSFDGPRERVSAPSVQQLLPGRLKDMIHTPECFGGNCVVSTLHRFLGHPSIPWQRAALQHLHSSDSRFRGHPALFYLQFNATGFKIVPDDASTVP
jgi:hypothetical protein